MGPQKHPTGGCFGAHETCNWIPTILDADAHPPISWTFTGFDPQDVLLSWCSGSPKPLCQAKLLSIAMVAAITFLHGLHHCGR